MGAEFKCSNVRDGDDMDLARDLLDGRGGVGWEVVGIRGAVMRGCCFWRISPEGWVVRMHDERGRGRGGKVLLDVSLLG